MPYKNEHAARLKDPSQFAKFGGRENDKGGPGIDFLYMVRDNGKSEMQSIRFDSKKYTPAAAKAWLKSHNIKFVEFEPASKDVNKNAIINTLEKLIFEENKKPELIKLIGTKDGLSYALDSRKPRRGDNLKIFWKMDNPEINKIYLVKAEVKPCKVDNIYTVSGGNLEIIDTIDFGKPDTTREIIIKANNAQSLKISKEARDEIYEVFKINPSDRDVIIKLPLIKAGDRRQVAYSVVMEPFDGTNKDLQGDYMTAEEIEKACHLFLEEHNQINLMHEKEIGKKARVVENYIAPIDFNINGEAIRKGSWVIGIHIPDSTLWRAVESGQLESVSIEGLAQNGPELM